MSPALNTSREPPDSRPAESVRKAVLICPACDHESPPGGDWTCRTVGRTAIRRCPDCHTVVERRPLFDERQHQPTALGPMVGAFRASLSLLNALRRAADAPARALTGAT